MPVALWIVNGILAAAFLAAGLMKLLRPREALVRAGMSFAGDTPPAAVKAIGAVEVLGALGLILPRATGIAPVLTPLAAVGLAVTMVGAIIVHVRRQECMTVGFLLLLLAIVSAMLGFLIL
ncbi:MAG: DoxX family protein [Propionibacteriales bacterium]|nr:DoxX family protein [Propionibacteriales bacterium]